MPTAMPINKAKGSVSQPRIRCMVRLPLVPPAICAIAILAPLPLPNAIQAPSGRLKAVAAATAQSVWLRPPGHGRRGT
ncbi:hypothetical protein XPN_4213 [Xanthomonas arboricola pv. pruni MAFF 301427]|nr:hypothetical protein XPN_4213 [Xanthomonas arboricola pv. pruni MAFF 301427]